MTLNRRYSPIYDRDLYHCDCCGGVTDWTVSEKEVHHKGYWCWLEYNFKLTEAEYQQQLAEINKHTNNVVDVKKAKGEQ